MNFTQLLRDITFSLHQKAYELKDEYSLQLKECQQEKEAFRQRINVLEDDVSDLKYNNAQLKESAVKTDLSQFKTNKLFKPRAGASSFKLSTWLNNSEERATVGDWVDDNLDISLLTGTIDEQAKQLRWMIFDHFGSKDIWEADKVQNTFTKPSEFIARDFKGNCNDWFVFIYYVYDYVFGDNNKLYCVMGGLNIPEGWNKGNHAYCLWHHSDGKYYILESAVGQSRPWNTYIQNSLDAFGVRDHRHNFRYSNIVWMANKHQTYYQVVLHD